jgi:hypothetical protein
MKQIKSAHYTDTSSPVVEVHFVDGTIETFEKEEDLLEIEKQIILQQYGLTTNE